MLQNSFLTRSDDESDNLLFKLQVPIGYILVFSFYFYYNFGIISFFFLFCPISCIKWSNDLLFFSYFWWWLRHCSALLVLTNLDIFLKILLLLLCSLFSINQRFQIIKRSNRSCYYLSQNPFYFVLYIFLFLLFCFSLFSSLTKSLLSFPLSELVPESNSNSELSQFFSIFSYSAIELFLMDGKQINYKKSSPKNPLESMEKTQFTLIRREELQKMASIAPKKLLKTFKRSLLAYLYRYQFI